MIGAYVDSAAIARVRTLCALHRYAAGFEVAQ
jgi:hypothetical protein